jgi:hypothetical protein
MSKITPIDPVERIKKEELERVIKRLQDMDLAQLGGLFLAVEYDGGYEADIVGMDFGLKGYIETHLGLIGEELIAYGIDEESENA